MAYTVHLPATGFLRVSQIVGNLKADPPVLPIIPIGRSSWWEGVRSGKYPRPVKLGPRTTAWRVEDIRALIEQANQFPESQIATGCPMRLNPTRLLEEKRETDGVVSREASRGQ